MSTSGDQLVSGGTAADVRPFSVFISYRRHDTGQAVHALQRALRHAFGPDAVYRDTSEEPGTEWLDQLKLRGSRATAFLALIGPLWFDEMRRRIGEVDYVRKEVEWALRDWPGHIIPVLIDTGVDDDAVDRLPRSIRPLFGLNVHPMRIESMDSDIEALIAVLRNKASRPGPVRRFERIAMRPEAGIEPATGQTAGAAGVLVPDESHYRRVLAYMLRGTVIPVLGSGARGRPPETDRLAAGLLARYAEVGPDCSDLAEVASRVWALNDDFDLHEAMTELVDPEAEPTDVHWFLARFPRIVRELGREPAHQMILTTNYDTALERAFEALCEPFDLLVYVPELARYVLFPWGDAAADAVADPIVDPQGASLSIREDLRLDRTLIIKLHGGLAGHGGEIEWSPGYIVTEDDYIDYPPGNVPKRVVDKLLRHRCLFLGYRLRDWNARVLLRRIWSDRRANTFWAVEDAPDLVEVSFWQKQPRSQLMSQSPRAYARALETMLAAWPADAASGAVAADG